MRVIKKQVIFVAVACLTIATYASRAEPANAEDLGDLSSRSETQQQSFDARNYRIQAASRKSLAASDLLSTAKIKFKIKSAGVVVNRVCSVRARAKISGTICISSSGHL